MYIAFAVFCAAAILLIGGVITSILTSWWGLTAIIVMLASMAVCRKSTEICDFCRRTVADIRDNWGIAMKPQTNAEA
jgi:ribose/xylose/arabinose/galactoside ABC-type transport system permease subunit